MTIEGINFTDLLLACYNEIVSQDSKNVNFFTMLNELSNAGIDKEEFEELELIDIPYAQKCNGKMRIIDGKIRLQKVKKILENLNIDYNNLVFPCYVEYVEEFNTNALLQIKK